MVVRYVWSFIPPGDLGCCPHSNCRHQGILPQVVQLHVSHSLPHALRGTPVHLMDDPYANSYIGIVVLQKIPTGSSSNFPAVSRKRDGPMVHAHILVVHPPSQDHPM
jgi:hypothetical protein